MNRPSHTTVVAYLALFLALGAGGAMAAGKLAKNSVGPKQLKKNSVSGPKIKKDAVTGAKVKDASLTGADLAAATITGANVKDGSLTESKIAGGVRASNVTGIALNADCSAAAPLPAGVSAAHLGGKGCLVSFSSSVLNCAVTATVSLRTHGLVLLAQRTVQTLRDPSSPNNISIFPRQEAAPTDLPVDLVVVC